MKHLLVLAVLIDVVADNEDIEDYAALQAVQEDVEAIVDNLNKGYVETEIDNIDYDNAVHGDEKSDEYGDESETLEVTLEWLVADSRVLAAGPVNMSTDPTNAREVFRHLVKKGEFNL